MPFERNEFIGDLLKTLRKLPPLPSLIAQLRWFHQKSLTEIAEVLHVAPSTVWQMEQDAMRQIRELMPLYARERTLRHRCGLPLPASLRNLIVACGITQLSLSRKIRLNPTRLSHIVNGWQKPTSAEKKRLARALKIHPRDVKW